MQSAFYYFTQAVCIGFVNMLAIYYMGKKLNMVLLNKFLLILFASINIIFGLSFFLKYGFNIMEYASLRVSLLSENTGIEYLNPITIGMNGAYLFISLLYIKEIKLIHFLLFVFAIFNLVISASKGPILSLAIVLFVYFFLKLKFEPKTLLKIVCGVTLSVMLFNSSIFESFVIFQRFTGAEEESTAQRNVAIEYALEQISICPLFGTNYFVVKNHSSPHNIFIDIILSTGVLGLFLFLPVIVKFLMRVYNRIADVPIMAFGLLAFCLAQTSGYVFGASDFWAFLGLILAYNHQNKGNLKTEYLKYS
jgi:O-antigen ligase